MSYAVIPTAATAVSAPGKVLLSGGYLVLDRRYTGTVFALNARVHVIVRQLQRGEEEGLYPNGGQLGERRQTGDKKRIDDKNGHGNPRGASDLGGNHHDVDQEEETVIVRSPQFLDAVWEYRIRPQPENGGIRVEQKGDGSRNLFVETTLNYALTYISYIAASPHFGSLSITILADNAYYSSTELSRTVGASRGTQFAGFGVRLQDAHKTGLGSSAALVTALVSALVLHRTLQPDELLQVRDKLHNLAQAAHCAAQGKVGSGFDIAAAVYGSCLYRRFSPAVLSSIGEVGSPNFASRLFSVVEDLNLENRWDAEITEINLRLPRGVRMVLCDVDCGSETPGMVHKLLRWREENRAQADKLWDELQATNEQLLLEFKQLQAAVDRQLHDDDDLPTHLDLPSLGPLHGLISHIRVLLCAMASASNVPVEPPAQTALLDQLTRLEGVVGGLVPGAGGYDALVLLLQEYEDIDVVAHLDAWLHEGFRPQTEPDVFGGRVERVGLLPVGQEPEGLRAEQTGAYIPWV